MIMPLTEIPQTQVTYHQNPQKNRGKIGPGLNAAKLYSVEDRISLCEKMNI